MKGSRIQMYGFIAKDKKVCVWMAFAKVNGKGNEVQITLKMQIVRANGGRVDAAKDLKEPMQRMSQGISEVSLIIVNWTSEKVENGWNWVQKSVNSASMAIRERESGYALLSEYWTIEPVLLWGLSKFKSTSLGTLLMSVVRHRTGQRKSSLLAFV